MFFGVVLAPGKAFSSTLQHDLMLSQVAIGRTGKKGERSVLELTVEGHKFVVATLRYGEVDQAAIDLHFVAGTSVQLSNPTGTADLHVVGNYIIENDFDMDSDDEGDDEIDSDEFGSDDDSDLEFSDDEEEDDDDDDISDDEPQAKRPASKPTAVSDAKRPASKPTAAAQKPESKTPQKPAADSKTPSKDNKTPVKADSKTPVKAADSKTPVKAADSKTPVKATDSKTPVKATDSKTPVKDDAPKPPADTPVKHPSGLRYLVLKAAPKAAPVAKKGRTVVVSYRGTLNQGGKQFDANKRFEFRLGAGDVIQGWDIGVAGMQVGEKRRLFVPPALGYGKDGVKERGVYVIPRNAPLDFDVELLQIK